MQQAGRRFAIEEEFFFVDPVSGDLVGDGIDRVFPNREAMPPMVMGEVWCSQVEVATASECHTLDELRSDALAQRSIVVDAAARSGLALLASGRHPFSSARGQQADPRERHEARIERLAHLGLRWDDQALVSGLHVHVHVEEDDSLDIVDRKFRATQVANRLLRDIYVLVALGANSPFAGGAETGYSSSRLLSYTSTIPGDSADYLEHMASITVPGPSAADWNDILRGDVQVSERLPTIEFRTPDSLDNVEDALLIAVLARAMVNTAIDDMYNDKPYVPARLNVLRRAKAVATRHGLDRVLLDVDAKRLVPASELLMSSFLPRHENALRASGDWDYAHDGVLRLLREGTGARRQRLFHDRAVQRFGEAFAGPALVEELVRRTARGIPPVVQPDTVAVMDQGKKRQIPSPVSFQT
jgi:glutamate---cysteine ligase / carboxylate-amine ligase